LLPPTSVPAISLVGYRGELRPLDRCLSERQVPLSLIADGIDMPANAGASRKPLTPYLLGQVPADLTGAVYAIGNFDGVHRGHAVLFETARQKAQDIGASLVALTFEPHPRTVFRPQTPVFRLTPSASKMRLFAALQVDGVIIIPFDRTFATHTADAFVADELIRRLAVKVAVVGYDFHFGRNRVGSPEFLRSAGARLGFDVSVVDPVSDENAIISSSRIRGHLELGEVDAANRLLGYRWFVIGEVVGGDRRGRDLGFPTANMRLGSDCRLRHGIYAVRVRRADGSEHDGVASFGRRPTFDNGAPLLEAHLVDFSGDLYGERVVVTFFDWIRPELRFDSADALIAEMNRDREAARRILAHAAPPRRLDIALAAIE
jgi:riboflavin kinase/FMN adenylyltransferase